MIIIWRRFNEIIFIIKTKFSPFLKWLLFLNNKLKHHYWYLSSKISGKSYFKNSLITPTCISIDTSFDCCLGLQKQHDLNYTYFCCLSTKILLENPDFWMEWNNFSIFVVQSVIETYLRSIQVINEFLGQQQNSIPKEFPDQFDESRYARIQV